MSISRAAAASRATVRFLGLFAASGLQTTARAQPEGARARRSLAAEITVGER